LNEVLWTEAALANLRAIRAYIEQFNPMAARTLAAALIAAGDSLANFPHRGRSVRNIERHPLPRCRQCRGDIADPPHLAPSDQSLTVAPAIRPGSQHAPGCLSLRAKE
jgi:plasmid stabilization system protein ParE